MKRTPCQFCERKFEGQDDLARHVRVKHKKAAKLVKELRAAMSPFVVAAATYLPGGALAKDPDGKAVSVYLHGVTVGDLRKLTEAYDGGRP